MEWAQTVEGQAAPRALRQSGPSEAKPRLRKRGLNVCGADQGRASDEGRGAGRRLGRCRRVARAKRSHDCGTKLSHPLARMVLVMEARSLRFAATARALGEAARAQGCVAPAFRSPPRIPGRNRSIRRHANGSSTISLVLRDRPWSSVVADMIDGIVAVNPDADPEVLRDGLWATIEYIDLASEGSGEPQPALRRAA